MFLWGIIEVMKKGKKEKKEGERGALVMAGQGFPIKKSGRFRGFRDEFRRSKASVDGA
jgi:hypothetical protein